MSVNMQTITKYEKAQILAIRATQIAQGSKPNIDLPEGMHDALKIAELELKNGKLDLIIERRLPNGEKTNIYTKVDLLK